MMTADEYYTQPDPKPEEIYLSHHLINSTIDKLIYGGTLTEHEAIAESFLADDGTRCEHCDISIGISLHGDADEFTSFQEFMLIVDHQLDERHALCESCYDRIMTESEEEVANL